MKHSKLIFYMGVVLLMATIAYAADDVLSDKIDVLSLVDNQQATLTATPIQWGSVRNCFDGDTTTIYCSANISPAYVQVTFSESQTVSAVRVLLGEPGYPHINSNNWWLERADNQSDMDSGTGSYQIIVPTRYDIAGEWDLAILKNPAAAKIWRFNVDRIIHDSYVRIPELELWSTVAYDDACRAVILVDRRLHELLQPEIDRYHADAIARRGFNIMLDADEELDDHTFVEIRDRILNYWNLCPNLEGVLFIGNIKLPSFYKFRSDMPKIRLLSDYYEDLDIQLSRYYQTGDVDPFCPDTPYWTWTYCQNKFENGFVVGDHDFDEVLTFPNQPELWTCYMPVGTEAGNSYTDFANKLRPYFEKLQRFYDGSYQPEQKMYIVSSDMFAGKYDFWQLYDHVTKVDYYGMNPATDCFCLESGRTIEQCYQRAPLEDYGSFSEFYSDFQTRHVAGDGWQDQSVFIPHLNAGNYEFVHVNVHSNSSWSIIYYLQAHDLTGGGMIMLGSGCSVAGYRQPDSPSNVDLNHYPDKNILANYLYGQSPFLAAIGAPSNRGFEAFFERLIDHMKNDNDYLGLANFKRIQHKYNATGYPIIFKEMMNEIMLGDPFLDVVQNYSTTPPDPPAAPAGLIATFDEENNVQLSWLDQSADERFFKIYRSTDGENWNYLATVTENVTTFTDIGPFDHLAYHYRVRAMNDGGNSGDSDPALVYIDIQLLNGDFEIAGVNETVPAHWIADAFSQSAEMNWLANVGRDGSHCVCIDIPAGDLDDARWMQQLNLIPDTEYVLRGWIKGEEIVLSQGPRGATLCIMNTWTHSPPLSGTFDWTAVEVEFTTPADGQVTVACRLGYWSSIVSGTAWFDDISLIPKVLVPVELRTFAAEYIDGSVLLQWTTVSETHNYGFEIQRGQNETALATIGFTEGHGTSTNTHHYTFTDETAAANTSYCYRLKQIDFDGSFEYSNILRITTGERRTRLTEFALHQNYPNPFNTATTIKYSLPDIGTDQALLRIDIYNILGETVRTLKNEPSRGGNFQVHWNGEDNAGQLVNSGIYMISVTYGGYSQVRKLAFVK